MKKLIPYGKQFLDEDDIKAVLEVLKSDFLTTGPKIKEFEDELCKYLGVKYCVAVSNGTAALHLASLVLLNKEDKVITTPNSFLATSNAILYAGAKPIFIDICEDGNIDLDLCEEELKKDSSIKAIYVVHFSGNSINQERLKYLRDTYGVKILEDCAHSLGANFGDIKAGSSANSDCSILSFHPVKHITTGEGGAITTNDEKIYKQLLELRSHGMLKEPHMKPWEYEMHSLGFNYRMTDIQAALGVSQLKKLDIFVSKRKSLAKKYDEMFSGTFIKPLYEYKENSSYHLYVLRVDFSKLNITKEQLFLKLKEKNIALQLHYIHINKQPFYKNLGYGSEKTPIMDRYYKECFSLPMYASLSFDEQEYVVKTLFEVLK